MAHAPWRCRASRRRLPRGVDAGRASPRRAPPPRPRPRGSRHLGRRGRLSRRSRPCARRARSRGHGLHRARARCPGTMDTARRARRFAKAPDAVARIAALGPRVIRLARSGNVTARLVVGAEAAALAWTLARVANALRLEGETAASWAGSLMGDDYFRAQVWRWARRQGLRVTPRAPRESALDAAARLAAARGR